MKDNRDPNHASLTTLEQTPLVLASSNRHKLREFRALLAELPVILWNPEDILPGPPPKIVEDGATFEENAWKKARILAERTGRLTLADDSGLEVDALGGRPGVRSARFAHEHASDEENNAALLTALAEVDGEQRTARYRCVLALVDPHRPGPPVLVGGSCEGLIARAPRGTGGFGYDPLFLVSKTEPSFAGLTMAELSDPQRYAIHHRGQAARALIPVLRRLFSPSSRGSPAI